MPLSRHICLKLEEGSFGFPLGYSVTLPSDLDNAKG